MTPDTTVHSNVEREPLNRVTSSMPTVEKISKAENTILYASGMRLEPKLRYSAWRRWSAVSFMSSGVLGGLLGFLVHHYYYQALAGEIVGSIDRQQWALRIGNLLAFITSTCLRFAISSACLQHLWYQFKRKQISLHVIDCIFDAPSNILSLLSKELWRQLPLPVIGVLIFWLIPIATIFPPATLSAISRPVAGQIQAPRPKLMYPTEWTEPDFFLDRPLIGDAKEYTSSARLQDLFDQVMGDRQPVPPLLLEDQTSFAYNITLALPVLQCAIMEDVGNMNLASMRSFTSSKDSAIDELLTHFFNGKVVKDLRNFSVGSDWSVLYEGRDNDHGWLLYLAEAQCMSSEDYDTTKAGISNFTLNPRFANFSPTTGVLENHQYLPDGRIAIGTLALSPFDIVYTQCIIMNTTFDLEVLVKDRSGKFHILSQKPIGEILLNFNETGDAQFLRSPHAPIAYWFRFLYNEVLGGSMLFRTDNQSRLETAESIAFHGEPLKESWEYKNLARLRESGGTKGLPFDSNSGIGVLLEQLSLNLSLSLMSDHKSCSAITVETGTSAMQTVYNYEPGVLFLSYGFAFAGTVLVVALGLLSTWSNGASCDNLFTTIAASMQHHEMPKIFRNCPIGNSMLDESVYNVEVRLQQRILNPQPNGIANENTVAYEFHPCGAASCDYHCSLEPSLCQSGED